MDGNQALAYGLIAAGVRYWCWLPDYSLVNCHGEIPRSELPNMRALRPREDELAAVSGPRFFLFRLPLGDGGAGPRSLKRRRSAGRRWPKYRCLL